MPNIQDTANRMDDMSVVVDAHAFMVSDGEKIAKLEAENRKLRQLLHRTIHRIEYMLRELDDLIAQGDE